MSALPRPIGVTPLPPDPPRSMCLGRSPATGARFLPVPLFAACTALLWAWFGAAFYLTARARRKVAQE